MMELTSCGVHSISCANGTQLVAVGDFLGKCHVFENSASALAKNTYKAVQEFGLPVRSLCFVDEKTIMVGGTDGSVNAWDLETDVVTFQDYIESTVTCMRYQNGTLMASSIEGVLVIWKFIEGNL